MGQNDNDIIQEDGNLSESFESNRAENNTDFEALMRQEGPIIYTLAVRLTGNMIDGQDLAQETFIRAFKNFKKFRGESSFRTWTYRICINLWKNKIRYEKRRPFWNVFSIGQKSEQEDAPAFDPPAPDPSLDEPLEQEERQHILKKALDKLEPEERAIIILREAENKSYEEISQLMEIPLGTVKSKISRGREHLRKILKPHLTESL